MEKELTKLKRRPFMFPLLMPLLVLAVAATASVWLWDMRSTTVVVLTTNAEVEANGDADPNLNLAGRERAARLARVLTQIQGTQGLDALFTSETRRAQQTVAPLAESLSLPINILPAAAWGDFADRLQSEQRGRTVLVVGHSALLPPLINSLSGESVTLNDAEFDHLYVVILPHLSRSRVLHLRY